MPALLRNFEVLLNRAVRYDHHFYFTNCGKAFLSLVYSDGERESSRKPNLANKVVGAWLKCCLWLFVWNQHRCRTSEKIAWHEPNDMSIASTNSLIVIRRFSETNFFAVFFACWRGWYSCTFILIHNFLALSKALVPLTDTFLRQMRWNTLLYL